MNTETITHEQIKELYKTSPEIKDMFPSVFEPKSGWYKDEKHPLWLMYCDLDNMLFYGFDFLGKWHHCHSSKAYVAHNISSGQPASESEVLEALTKEAEKRGFVKGANVKGLESQDYCDIVGGFNFFYELNMLNAESDRRHFDPTIFKNGVWAEIIPTQKEMTVAEIEKELGYKIKIIGQ